jgi:hypothetical protein
MPERNQRREEAPNDNDPDDSDHRHTGCRNRHVGGDAETRVRWFDAREGGEHSTGAHREPNSFAGATTDDARIRRAMVRPDDCAE